MTEKGFKDVSARFKKKTETSTTARQDKPMDFAESYRLRGKMLGVLLRDARLQAARTIEACAHHVRISLEEYESWEYGDAVPSLPQLELLAYFLDVPVSHFWGFETFESSQESHVDFQLEYLALRNRMIGVMLRQAREEAGVTLEVLSADSGLPVEQITAYELGEAIPMHELRVLANGVQKNVSYFLESSDHVGKWLTMREEWDYFVSMSDDLREFTANPRHIGYLQLAIAFSRLPNDAQRQVAESMLEITM
ncbi:MAG: transcriptional regulator [Anaerolineaceae bacterium]|nr:transcriptional regulator [Anaerolineaceae bacterium]